MEYAIGLYNITKGTYRTEFVRFKYDEGGFHNPFPLSGTTSSDILCMYGHTYSKSMDQPGKVANPARGQLISPFELFYSKVLNYIL